MTGPAVARPAGTGPLLERALATAFIVGVSMRTQWEETRTSPFPILLGIVQPAVFLLVTLAPLADPDAAVVTSAAFGVLLTSFWGSTIWAAGGILRRDRTQGTLVRALTSVHSPLVVVLGRALCASLMSVASVALTVSTMLLAWGEPVRLDDAPLLVLGVAVVVGSGTAIGLLIGSLFLLSRHGPALSSALMYPVYLLGGMLVPVSAVPTALRWLSGLISLRWLKEFFVTTAAGAPSGRALAAAVALTVAYLAGGTVLFGRVLHVARRRGSLELV